MTSRFDRLLGLPAQERLLLVELAILLPTTRMLLRWIGFGATRRLFAATSNRVANGDIGLDAIAFAERIGWLVGVAARHGPVSASCLPRAIVLCWLLRRRAIPARLRIGVRTLEAEFFAHAWVELGDRAIAEPLTTRLDYAAYEGLDAVRGA